MRWFVLLACLMLPAPLAAQIRVTGGEHGAFTRLVLQGPGLTGWQVTRLPQGYSLRLRAAARFDLSAAFDKIDRRRLAGLSPDSSGDGLSLTLRCDCHAIPFDFRPGIVVIDLRDGPPPEQSSFELSADGARLPPLTGSRPDAQRPRARPALTGLPDWTLALRKPQPVVPPGLPPPDAAALRAALLQQFARAASQGLVDPARPAPPPSEADMAVPRQATMHLAAPPGVRILPAPDKVADLGADGVECIPAESLSVENWGDPAHPLGTQLAEGMAALTGEFDRPDPQAIARAIRLRLWLGFGAEAAMIARAFPPQDDTTLWQALAHLVDDANGPPGPLAGMAGCDGPAALWAALAEPDSNANTPAVLRAFSALPAHLRMHLGPPLADRFLAAGDSAAAQAVSDAMARAAPDGTELVNSAIALHLGDAERAEDAALAARDTARDPTAALVALTLARAARQPPEPVAPADVTALEAALHATPDAPDLARATVLARALAGDFDGAFAMAPQVPEAERDLWHILARNGPDSALMSHAILPADAAPQAEATTTVELANRLIALGFGTAALRWIGPDGDPLLAARAELARNDPRAALWRLSKSQGDEADTIRTTAMARLDSPDGPPLVPKRPDGDTSPEWQRVEAALDLPALPQGPLSRSRALLDAATETRSALEALLDATAVTGSKDSDS